MPKVLQNQLYDNFILSYGYGIPIRSVAEDTLIKGWSVYAELPRALATQASVWTRQPYWKNSTMYEGGEPLYVGCAMDSAVTLEICNAQDGALSGARLAHYRKMIELQNPFLYMELRGIRYNSSVIEGELAQVRHEIAGVGAKLEQEADHQLRGKLGSLSSPRLIKTLYDELNYPPQFRKEAGRKTTTRTSDIEAILNLKKPVPLMLPPAGSSSSRS